MYRSEAHVNFWVPILANPNTVKRYSINTLNENLLLPGEDRYLTMLVLKTFPQAKERVTSSSSVQNCCPQYIQHPPVSSMDQWHYSQSCWGLLVCDHCDPFCFSVRFVVGMELAGTLRVFLWTLHLIVISINLGGFNTTFPLVLLAVILGLPGFLIVITSP